MRFGLALMAFALAAAPAAGQPVPPELARLAQQARLPGPVAAWCPGGFQPGRPGEFAVAVSAAGTGGRYVVLHADGTATELAAFARKPDLSCYSRARAVALNTTLGQSTTIHGRITPRWSTTVICGFVDDTSAVCWQYSPDARAFVEVGGWTT